MPIKPEDLVMIEREGFTVENETLSNGSLVWNVLGCATKGGKTQAVRFICLTQSHANILCAELSRCSDWEAAN